MLAFGDAVLFPALTAGHLTDNRLGLISVAPRHPAAVAKRLRAAGLRAWSRAALASATDQQRETQRRLNGVLALVVFAFTSIAVVNTLTMIALQRGREIGLLRLVGVSGARDDALGGGDRGPHRRRRRDATRSPR
jgi:hypothetical protein